VAPAIISKRCPRCKTTKPTVEFSRNSRQRDGLASYCKACSATMQRDYAKTPRGRATHLRSVRKWQDTEKGKAAHQRYVESHQEEIRQRAAARARTPKGKEQGRKRRLRSRYGLSPEEYAALLTEQGGECALCGSKEARGRWGTHFHVDHCHASGKVRGLLCASCNSALAQLGDSVEGLTRALDYVRRADYRK
jgi:5-methylcytosine-specific restriction endonuclease McrA